MKCKLCEEPSPTATCEKCSKLRALLTELHGDQREEEKRKRPNVGEANRKRKVRET